MSDKAANDFGGRYDRLAGGYADWWGPVIAPAALTVLDTAQPMIATGATRILDVGTGTGTLAIEAARRWPAAHIDAVDSSDGMLAVARRTTGATDGLDADGRLDFRQAFADRLPYPDATFDLVVSSFVLQLVPNRHRALREARRVLRPGGHIVLITWLASRADAPFEPDEVFDDVLEEFDLDVPGDDPHPGDFESPAAAAAQFRRAGFREVQTEEGLLRHAYQADEYADFLERFDEEDLFASLDRVRRKRVRAELLSRLRALPADDLVLRLPTVLVRGVRP